MTHVANKIAAEMSGDFLEELGNYLVQIMRQSLVAYDEADYILRFALHRHFLRLHEFTDAAKILGDIKFDSSVFVISDADKANTYVTIAGMDSSQRLPSYKSYIIGDSVV
jgi:hypothetical protein